jgi:tRNA threonylcarbamoyladenosine biosynthesis protein TsaB
LILGIDTTTEYLYLALVDTTKGNRFWTKWAITSFGKTHSVILLPNIDDLLKTALMKTSDISGVAACIGPGGFTSLRIGVATAEGLAITGLPTWAYSAFELRAKSIYLSGYTGPIWILLNGQRNDVFMQLWENNKPITIAQKQPLSELYKHTESDNWWAPKSFCNKVTEYLLQPPYLLIEETDTVLTGLAVLCRELSCKKPEKSLIPFYLREVDAEINFPQASKHLPAALSKGQFR